MSERDLPDGIIDAYPLGGRESAEAADGETSERNESAGAPTPPLAPPDSDEANQGADPDLIADAHD